MHPHYAQVTSSPTAFRNLLLCLPVVGGFVKGYHLFFLHPSYPGKFHNDVGVFIGWAENYPSSDSVLMLGFRLAEPAVNYEKPSNLRSASSGGGEKEMKGFSALPYVLIKSDFLIAHG